MNLQNLKYMKKMNKYRFESSNWFNFVIEAETKEIATKVYNQFWRKEKKLKNEQIYNQRTRLY